MTTCSVVSINFRSQHAAHKQCATHLKKTKRNILKLHPTVGFLERVAIPYHQTGGLGSAVSSPRRVWGGAPAAKRLYNILSTQVGLSWHFSDVFVAQDRKSRAFVADIAYLVSRPGRPLYHSVQRCASQKSIPGWKHCNKSCRRANTFTKN